jgi:hypothetical protein
MSEAIFRLSMEDNIKKGANVNHNGSHTDKIQSRRILLEIRYIKKQGYFCDSCAEDLLQNDLAIKEVDSNV